MWNILRKACICCTTKRFLDYLQRFLVFCDWLFSKTFIESAISKQILRWLYCIHNIPYIISTDATMLLFVYFLFNLLHHHLFIIYCQLQTFSSPVSVLFQVPTFQPTLTSKGSINNQPRMCEDSTSSDSLHGSSSWARG